MFDKDKSEHCAAGSVLVKRALTGIQAAVEQLNSLQTADFESLWQSSAASPQQQTGNATRASVASVASVAGVADAAANLMHVSTADVAEAYICFLASSAKYKEAVMLGDASGQCPQQPSLPTASAH